MMQKILIGLMIFAIVTPVCAWTENMIGNWEGSVEGNKLELSLWIADDSIGAERVMLRGYLRFNRSGNDCVKMVYGSRTIWTFLKDNDLPKEAKYGVVSLSSRQVGHLLQQCESMRYGFYVFADGIENTLSLFMDNPLTRKLESYELKRVSASPEMLTIIATDPLSSYSGYWRNNSPSTKELNLIKNASLASDNYINRLPLPCGEYSDRARWEMAKHDIVEITSLTKSGGEIEVTVNKGPNGGLSRNIVPRLSDIDWSNMFLSSTKEPDGKKACLQGKAVLSYFKALNNGQFVNSKKEYDVQKTLINDVKGFFLVDKSGVDRIHHGGSSTVPGIVKREYGTMTIFMPGDVTRKALWNHTAQSLRLLNTVKSSQTGKIEDDILNPVDEIVFRYDAKLGDKFGTKIWSSNHKNANDPIVCIRWSPRHHVNDCVEKFNSTEGQPYKYYLTSNLDIAKHLFRSISPNASMIDSNSIDSVSSPTDQCTTGAFCNLPGGQYFNAIYEGNHTLIRQLDDEYFKSFNSYRDQAAEENIIVGAIFDLIDNGIRPSAIGIIAREYMHEYKNNSTSCIKPGAQLLRRTATTDSWITTDYYGNKLSQAGGFDFSGTYLVNAEFVELCQKLCTVRDFGDYVRAGLAPIVNAVPVLMQQYDCDSKEIKQFEKNLISLYIKSTQKDVQFYQRNAP